MINYAQRYLANKRRERNLFYINEGAKLIVLMGAVGLFSFLFIQVSIIINN